MVVGGTILAGLGPDYFHNEFTQETYKHILASMRKNGEPPKWRDLLEDPGLAQETRKKLRDTSSDRISSTNEARAVLANLNKYRQMRGIFEMSESATKKLRKSQVDVDELIEEASANLIRLRQSKADTESIVTFGKGNNAGKTVKGLLSNEKANFVPTGFSDYDKENGGIFFGSLFTIGATSGGGKSATASQLAINWAGMGEHVCIVPLEMTKEEMTGRVMANAANLDVRKILLKKLSEEEKRKYLKSYRKMALRFKKADGAYSIFKPQADMTIEEIMASVYTLDPSIIIIDYISLLKGVDGDDAWQKLGAVARYCKVYAEVHNKIVVLLAQVSEDGKIRYAQAIKEHSNNCLVGDTLIFTDDGFKFLDEVCPAAEGKAFEKLKVQAGSSFEDTSVVHNNGRASVTALTTHEGITVEGTADHLVQVLDRSLNLVWRPINDVDVGDYLVVPKGRKFSRTATQLRFKYTPNVSTHNGRVYNVTTKFPSHMTDELARLIGYLIGDGYVSRTHLGFATKDKEVMDDFVKCFESCFDHTPTVSGNGFLRARCDKTSICTFFGHIADMVLRKSDRKYLPVCVLNSKKQHIQECVRALFNCDGSWGKQGFTFASVSKKLAMSLQQVLLHFGIVSRLATRDQNKSNFANGKLLYLLTVHSGKNLELLYHTFPAISDRKKVRVAKASRYLDTVPHVKTILDEIGFTKAYPYVYNTKDFTGKVTGKATEDKAFLETLGAVSPRLVRRLKELNKVDVHYAKVIRKNKTGRKVVYDLTVPSVSAFNANGAYVHNCWIFVSTKQTRENEIINVEQLKARNGRLFDFTLSAKLDVMRIGDLDIEEREKYVEAKEEKKSKKGKDKDGKKSKRDREEPDSKEQKRSKANQYLSDQADGDDDD